MPIQPGDRLGPYEILSALGAGGMGEVYRARDTKLDRDVAIKILPDLFAQDAERLVRFEREAKTLASLNHPNIAQIYGIEDRALVMELVEGEDLSAHIARGPIALAEALPIARQIADALEAAHESGIIHRDLKPANIKIRPNGTVKVLDFGLAKAMDPAGSSAAGDAAMNSPTLTARATQMGMIIGTAAYMAPEQAKGKSVDRRADVWAFGVVLYEMLTGKRAFAGDDVSETLASVLKDTPLVAALPTDVPASVRRLLRRCLEKDRAKRLDSMGAARLDLEEAMAGEPAPIAAITAAPKAVSRLDPRMIAAALVLAAAAGIGAWVLKPAPAVQKVGPARFAITLPKDVVYTRSGTHVLAMAPDGSRIAYIAGNQLLVRAIDQLEPAVVVGVRDPSEVFFSPDSQWIGFYLNAKIWKVALTGGAPVPVCEAQSPAGASWSGDEILFAQTGGIMRVAASGGTPELLIATAEGAGLMSTPRRVPGSRDVMFSRTRAATNWDEADIVVWSPGGAERVILRGGSDPRLLPTGHLVYGRRGELLVVPVNSSTLATEGTPMTFVSGVPGSGGGVSGTRQYGISDTGTLVHVSGGVDELTDLIWSDRQGREEILLTETQAAYPRVSPDGQRIAYSAPVAGNTDVYIYEWARKAKSRLTFDAAVDQAPVWSADGKRMIYASGRTTAAANLYWQPADGTGTAERLTTGPNQQWPYAVTRDGKTLIYIELGPKTSYDIYAISLTGDRTPRPLLTSPADERRPTLSPDDKWMAYQSDESGTFEIFVRPFPDVNGGRWQVSAGGGASPIWGADLHEIFYRSGQDVFRVGVSTSPAFVPAAPSKLFGLFFRPDTSGMQYGLAPDGKRFMLIKAHGSGDVRSEYHVVMNWFDEVRARVPRSK
jgi:serine/threonine-protein kinase